MNSHIASTQLEKALNRDAFSSLGIAVDNLDMEEAVSRIAELIEQFGIDGQSRSVATLNVDFMVNALGYFFSQPQHPELLEILRRSDLVTADGFPVVLLSKIINSPIKARVTGADLVPALAKRAVKANWSIFLLGGQAGSADEAAAKLMIANPGLRIAGTNAPMIHTAGEALMTSEEDDARLVAEINETKPDILLIGLGNPKQELRFHRNRDALKVPVSIGVGGTFEFIAGRTKRAPNWIQKSNLEWVFRIAQDPKRLWRRYVNGMIKLAMMTAPLLWIRFIESFYSPKNNAPTIWKTLWSSRDNVIQTVRLPKFVTKNILQDLLRCIREHGDRMLVVDMQNVKHVELAAHFTFYEIARLFTDGVANGVFLNLSPKVQRRLEAGRIMDACDASTSEISEVHHSLSGSDEGQTTVRSYVLENSALIYLGGRVTARSLKDLGFSICLEDMARDRLCVVDVRYVSRMDSSTIVSLFRSVKNVPCGRSRICISGLDKAGMKVLENTGLKGKIKVMDDKELANQIFTPGGLKGEAK